MSQDNAQVSPCLPLLGLYRGHQQVVEGGYTHPECIESSLLLVDVRFLGVNFLPRSNLKRLLYEYNRVSVA